MRHVSKEVTSDCEVSPIFSQRYDTLPCLGEMTNSGTQASTVLIKQVLLERVYFISIQDVVKITSKDTLPFMILYTVAACFGNNTCFQIYFISYMYNT